VPDVDLVDAWGRNIVMESLISNTDIMGGMPEKEPAASRAGAAGQFHKWLANYYRLQPMPWETAILWKNNLQYSNYYLVASEEFQIGGPSSVRGYPPAEFGGDSGYYTALEWSVPIYFLPKDWRVPMNKEKLYDTLRIVAFYDWATAELNRTAVGEKKKDTLKGIGCGLRFNLRDNVSFRIEVGWPLGQKPSDDDHVHPWVELVTRF
jgi:hemolysin activation/secretion protein